MTRSPSTLAIVGPTASGKTTLAIEVALRLSGEIVSMDSRQIYGGMDIGTAKATASQRSLVPHHGLDLVRPGERFSAGRFARYARECISGIEARGRLPILAGGTGFFLRALTHPIFREPELDPAQRADLASFLESMDDDSLRVWLRALDPVTGEKLSRAGGRQRLLRAIEIPLLTGRPLPWWHAHAPPEAPPLQPLVFVLDLPRDRLYEAIDRRVDSMLRDGLLDELADLLHQGHDELTPGLNATGYVELIPHLRGEISLEEAADRIRRNTRAYARRQLTWLRHQLPAGARWLDAARTPTGLADEIGDAVARAWREGEK
jgi:tRNA dimethylallyltransferase